MSSRIYVWLKTQSSIYMYCKSKSWTSSRLIMSYEKSHKNTNENINWKKKSNIAWSYSSQSLQWSDNHGFMNQLKGNKKRFIINYAHYSWMSAAYDIFSVLCGNYLHLELHLKQVIYRLTEASKWKKRCMKALITCVLSFKLKNPLTYFFLW